MKAEKNARLAEAFVITEESLRRLDQLITEDSGEHSYSLRCSDGSVLTPESLAEILDFPNAGKRRIVEIKVTTGYSSKPVKPHIRLSLDRASDISWSITYTVEGNDDREVYSVSERIEEWIASVRQR